MRGKVCQALWKKKSAGKPMHFSEEGSKGRYFTDPSVFGFKWCEKSKNQQNECVLKDWILQFFERAEKYCLVKRNSTLPFQKMDVVVLHFWKNTIRHLIGSFFWHDRSFIHATIATSLRPEFNCCKNSKSGVCFSKLSLCVRFVVLPSRWALFNFYDSSHSWKQRKIDIQGDYGNVFLTQKMTQFLWPVYSGEEQQGHLVTTFSKQERNEWWARQSH